MGVDNIDVLYTDAALEGEDIKNKKLRLSIELGLDGFSFSIKDIDDNLYVAYGSKTIKYGSTYTRLLSSLIETVETTPVLNPLRYEEVILLYNDTIYTVMPTDLYDERHRKDYLSFTVGRDLTQDKSIKVDAVVKHNAVCVYQSLEKVEQYLSTRTRSIIVRHSVSAFMDSVPEDTVDVHLYVNMYNTHMCVAVTGGEGLQMVNTYKVKEKSAFAYYMLSVCNHLGVNEREVSITLYGSVERYTEYADAIKRYFPNARFAKRNEMGLYSASLDMLAECESPNVFNL